MKKLSAILLSMMLSGCAVGGSNTDSLAEQDATAQRAKQFLSETSPRNMDTDHPRAEDNIINRIYTGSPVTPARDPDRSDSIEEIE
jgi:hypothetical protein